MLKLDDSSCFCCLARYSVKQARYSWGSSSIFCRGRERYLVFVKNPFAADSDNVNVFSGNGATQEEFIALKNDSTAKDALPTC